MSPEKKVNILLVDDRHEGLLALEAVLARSEYNLIKAQSGAEALKCLLDHDVAVILLDVQMPDLDGFETATIIKQRERCREIPIIFITALNKDEEYVFRGYEVGAVDYIFKPLDPLILRSKVAVFVDLFRKTQEIKRQAELLREVDRKEKERELAALELEGFRRYQNLADAIPNIVWRARPCGTKEYFNKVWTDYTGLSIAQSADEGWQALIHPDDLREYLCTWKTALHNESIFEVECRIRRNTDGVYYWHLGRAVPERNESGAIIAWLGSYTEIHERKEAEQERLRLLASAEESASRFSQLAATLPHFVWESNMEGRTWMNRGWCEYTGLSEEESIGMGWLKAVHPDDRLVMNEAWQRCLAGASEYVVEHRVLGKDGKYRWFQGRGVPLRGLDGSVTRWVGTTIDIQPFRDLDEQRANFLSLASHELKTPLTAIKASLQIHEAVLKGQRQMPEARLKRLVETGVRSVNRLDDLLDDLLDYSRVESGRLSIEPKRADLAEALREAISSCMVQIDERFKIVAELPERLEGVWDTRRLRQVTDNLLNNAIKYSPRAGKIQVQLRRARGEAVLSVRDEGIGIAPEDQSRIFRPFERAVDAKNFGGFGIGLYVSARIVEQHKGKIEVKSEVGRGSTFTVRLPLHEPEMMQ